MPLRTYQDVLKLLEQEHVGLPVTVIRANLKKAVDEDEDLGKMSQRPRFTFSFFPTERDSKTPAEQANARMKALIDSTLINLT